MSRYQRVPVKDLIVDDRYQRAVDEKRVEKIAADFNERLFGVLEVNQRNGKAAVFDGQHRLAAAVALGMDKVPCMVHHDLTPEEEAILFVELQPVDAFKARVFAGDKTAIAINSIVESAGFIVSQRSGYEAGQQHAIASINALERTYQRGNLAEALDLLQTIWGGDEKSTDAKLVEGLGIFEYGYGHRLDADVLAKLSAESPVTVLRRVKGRATTLGGNQASHAQLAAEEIRKIAGLRGSPRRKRTEQAS